MGVKSELEESRDILIRLTQPTDLSFGAPSSNQCGLLARTPEKHSGDVLTQKEGLPQYIPQ